MKTNKVFDRLLSNWPTSDELSFAARPSFYVISRGFRFFTLTLTLPDRCRTKNVNEHGTAKRTLTKRTS